MPRSMLLGFVRVSGSVVSQEVRGLHKSALRALGSRFLQHININISISIITRIISIQPSKNNPPLRSNHVPHSETVCPSVRVVLRLVGEH